MNFFPMRRLVLSMSFFVLFTTFFSCSSDNEEDLFEDMMIETASFADNILPILQTNCYGCHSVDNAVFGAGLILEGHSNLISFVDSNKFPEVLTGAGGLSVMPPSGQLTTSQIDLIQQWIDEGALDN